MAKVNLDHIGIAVCDLEKSLQIYRLLGITPSHREVIADQGVELLALPVGRSRIELLQPLSSDTPIGRFISRNGEGLHHIAIEVTDIAEILKNCIAHNIKLIDAEPRRGAEGCQIAFLHPKSTGGVLIELVQR